MRTAVALGWAALVVLSFVRRISRCDLAPGRRTRRSAIPPADVALGADLLAVAITGGLTPWLAVQVASAAGPPSLAAPLGAVIAAAGSGQRLAHALEDAAAATPEVRNLFLLLATSERSGAPIGPLVARLAGDERSRSRRAALVRARRLPVQLLFPLVFLLFPAFLVLTVAPALIAGLR